jgi:hypothetical protein
MAGHISNGLRLGNVVAPDPVHYTYCGCSSPKSPMRNELINLDIIQ